ncbi:tRNA adenosine(34) deaminase TadA [Christensenella sp. MSJ-20]|uniref:tRNA adenosine(34) deaminase TadA n=1 Tax=Christensenella sp. MSJ-20 TaxID=2841518 RepID=UPI000D79AF30|nr:MAG: tRNA-specific adenosine deaminase [Bacillota bacterium]QWT55464.1 tRNA adenosine(34) deaminase TadA [Christensenella sp. MSJ-20]
MAKALCQAQAAARKGEVPVGAVVVREGSIVARAHNLRETRRDPAAHAELIALQRAAKKLGGWRLMDCTVYVTLEPCPMCAGAMINARVARVVFGAFDPKAGCCGTLYQLIQDGRFNHTCPVTGGVLEAECAGILKEFFARKRRNNRDTRRDDP